VVETRPPVPGIDKPRPLTTIGAPLKTALLLPPLLAVCASAAFAARPNLILVLADDLGYGEIGSQGQRLIQTPRLDRMAAEGIRLPQFYAGSTVCAPSRSVLMTGRHAGHTRVRGNARGNPVSQKLLAEDVTVAETLRDAGYATGLVGKWGLGLEGDEGHPNLQGFGYFFGFINQTHAHNHYPDFLWRNTERVSLPNDLVPVDGTVGAGYATKPVAYADDLFFDEAASFVERNRDRPFFLMLSLTVPHANNERARMLGDGQEVPDYGPYAAKPWPVPQRGQAAMITRMDEKIGRLLDQLQRLGLDENTLVVFSSDNGPHREGGPEFDPEFFDANGPFRGIKRDLTDGGIRVPFIARWPGRIASGAVSGHVAYLGDLMATFAEAAGTTAPSATDSLSLLPTLLGQGTQAKHDHLYWEFHEKGPAQAVLLEGRWKGVRPAPPEPVQLYDLAIDPGELTDVAARHPDLAARMRDLMRTAHVPNEHWRITETATP